MQIGEFVKDHPYITGGGVFVLGVVLIVIFMSGDDTSEAPAPVVFTPDNTSLVEANTRIALGQMQANVQSRAIDADAMARGQEAAAAKDMAALQARSAVDIEALKQATALASVYQSNETERYVSSMNSQVEVARSLSAERMNDNNNRTVVANILSNERTNDNNNRTALALGGQSLEAYRMETETAKQLAWYEADAAKQAAWYSADAVKTASFNQADAAKTAAFLENDALKTQAFLNNDAFKVQIFSAQETAARNAFYAFSAASANASAARDVANINGAAAVNVASLAAANSANTPLTSTSANNINNYAASSGGN